MTVHIDGKPAQVRDGATVSDLLALAGRDPARTLVTVDGKFVPAGKYRELRLKDGARLMFYELHDGG